MIQYIFFGNFILIAVEYYTFIRFKNIWHLSPSLEKHQSSQPSSFRHGSSTKTKDREISSIKILLKPSPTAPALTKLDPISSSISDLPQSDSQPLLSSSLSPDAGALNYCHLSASAFSSGLSITQSSGQYPPLLSLITLLSGILLELSEQ